MRRARLADALPAWLFATLCCVSSVAIFVPLLPIQPTAGLDPSWAMGMNQAVAQGLAFGREIIFTFGPYAALYTLLFHPATDHLMIVAGSCLAIGFSVATYLAFRRQAWYVQLSFVLASAAVMPMRDALFFIYPLLVGLLILGISGKHRPIESLPLLALLVIPLGLLPLIKLSMAAASLGVIALSAAVLMQRRRWWLLFTVIAVPSASMALFWLVSGQEPGDLWRYFASGAAIIGGYAEAMSLDGNPFEVAAYSIVAILVVAGVAEGETGETPLPRALRCILFAGLLFLTFKAAFIRHDIHGLIAANFLLPCTLIAGLTLTTRRYFPLLLASALTFGVIVHNLQGAAVAMIRHVPNIYISAAQGMAGRIADPDFLERAFIASLADIEAETQLPRLNGSTDVYSYNQAGLLAAGSRWQPRPVLQSYSAYTPELAEANKMHLQGGGSPDNLIFSVQPIDMRLPSLEDGPSWRAILWNYSPTRMVGDSLVLQRNATGDDTVLPVERGPITTHDMGEAVAIKTATDLVFAKIRIEMTPWGRLRSLLFKPGQLRIVLRTADQAEHEYRLVAGMAQSEFLLSPLVETTEEFKRLYEGTQALSAKRVQSISILDESWPPSWKDRYTLQLPP